MKAYITYRFFCRWCKEEMICTDLFWIAVDGNFWTEGIAASEKLRGNWNLDGWHECPNCGQKTGGWEISSRDIKSIGEYIFDESERDAIYSYNEKQKLLEEEEQKKSEISNLYTNDQDYNNQVFSTTTTTTDYDSKKNNLNSSKQSDFDQNKKSSQTYGVSNSEMSYSSYKDSYFNGLLCPDTKWIFLIPFILFMILGFAMSLIIKPMGFMSNYDIMPNFDFCLGLVYVVIGILLGLFIKKSFLSALIWGITLLFLWSGTYQINGIMVFIVYCLFSLFYSWRWYKAINS